MHLPYSQRFPLWQPVSHSTPLTVSVYFACQSWSRHVHTR